MSKQAAIHTAIVRSRRMTSYAYGVVDQRTTASIGHFVKKAACRKCRAQSDAIRLTEVRDRTEQRVYFYHCQRCGSIGPIAKTIGMAKALWNKQQKEKHGRQ